ncbi:MAG: hypothetical protein ACRDBG_04600 [Waterburya sp.]
MPSTANLIGDNAIVAGISFEMTIYYPQLDLTSWQLEGVIKSDYEGDLLAQFQFLPTVYGAITANNNTFTGSTIVPFIPASVTALIPSTPPSPVNPYNRACPCIEIGKTHHVYQIDATDNAGKTIALILPSAVEVKRGLLT